MSPGLLRRVVLAAVLAGLSVAPDLRAEPPYAGRPLLEVLGELEDAGLALVYSSDLVRPEMEVREEPTADSIQGVLEELLGPHRLAPEIGPRGRILVVRRKPRPLEIRFRRPIEGELVTRRLTVSLDVYADEPVDRVRILVDGRERAVLRERPFRTVVGLEADDGDREATAHVLGRWGGEGWSSVGFRQVRVTDSVELVLRQLFVTVTRDGRPLRGLAREDFELSENGARRELVTFGAGDMPLAAAVLLDLSGSMSGGRCELALAGARAFLSRLDAEDRAMVLAFSDRTLAVTPFRPGLAELSARPCPSPHSGGTALNDHLYAGLRLLDEEASRRVVVLLSDGADVSSALDMRDVLWKVEQSTTTIYWIRVRGETSAFESAWRGADDNRRQERLLERAVELSGGRIVRLEDPDEIESAFDEVVEELRAQYVLGYYSEQRAPGETREVRVSVDRLWTDVRFREIHRDE